VKYIVIKIWFHFHN